MKFLCYHGSTCDVMCCMHAIIPLRKKSILAPTKIRFSLFQAFRILLITTNSDILRRFSANARWHAAQLPLVLHFMLGHKKVTWLATLEVAATSSVRKSAGSKWAYDAEAWEGRFLEARKYLTSPCEGLCHGIALRHITCLTSAN